MWSTMHLPDDELSPLVADLFPWDVIWPPTTKTLLRCDAIDMCSVPQPSFVNGGRKTHFLNPGHGIRKNAQNFVSEANTNHTSPLL